MHFLLLYDYSEDYLQRRAPHRNEHLRLAWEAHERGDLVLGGALADAPAGAVLLFQGASDEAARAFAAKDPYVLSGVVTNWTVRPWTTVAGATAATPIRRVD